VISVVGVKALLCCPCS